MYFDHAPKHMIRLSVEYRQDSKIPIRLWKSLVEDTPSRVVHLTPHFGSRSAEGVKKKNLHQATINTVMEVDGWR